MVAFTMLSFATYGLWWNKPLDLHRLMFMQGGNLGGSRQLITREAITFTSLSPIKGHPRLVFLNY